MSEPLLRVIIPGVPDIRMSPNRPTHWRTESKLAAQARGEAKNATKFVLNGTPFQDCTDRYRFDVIVGWPKRRKLWDSDNLVRAMKPVRDGICDALGIDDKRVDVGKLTQAKVSDGAGEMIISVWEAA